MQDKFDGVRVWVRPWQTDTTQRHFTYDYGDADACDDACRKPYK